MNIKNVLNAGVAAALLCLVLTTPVMGADTIEAGEAFTSWFGKGHTYETGNRVLFSGAIDGVMFIRHYKGTLRGPIHAAKLHCHVIMNLEPSTKARTSSGFCVLRAHEGKDVAYAELRCAGSGEECEGSFDWIGGEGEFKGISGSTKIRSRLDLDRDDVGSISGFAIWPNLTYRLP